jgi:hypothetical protein
MAAWVVASPPRSTSDENRKISWPACASLYRLRASIYAALLVTLNANVTLSFCSAWKKSPHGHMVTKLLTFTLPNPEVKSQPVRVG